MLFPQQSLFPRQPPCPAVLTVFDLYHLQSANALPLAERIFRRGIYGYSLKRADRLIAISECTRQALISSAGIASERVVAVPLGFDAAPTAEPLAPPRIAGRYVYYPAATWPAKNHAVLFETLAHVRRSAEWGDRQLVLSGIQTRLWPQLRRLVAQLGLDDIVRHLGYVPAAEVQALYAGAEAVLFPSRFEGFGLPVLEAAALGKKVIVSQLDVFRELGVPERFRIDFTQPEQLLRALAEPGPTVLEKSPVTWDECTIRTLDVLRDAAGRPR
jgi:glycosyltransferase involved in cell wall biosynthesis